MATFFSKFKFKYWSWELDAIKIVPSLLIVLSFLPVLPYEKKDGDLYVLGRKGSVENFYELGFNKLDTRAELKEGEIFYEFNKLYKIPFPEPMKHREYLIEKGVSKALARCISFRDFLLSNYFFDAHEYNLGFNYKPSPVPAIWLARILFIEYLSSSHYLDDYPESLNKFSKICNLYENMGPPRGYLEGNFSYKE